MNNDSFYILIELPCMHFSEISFLFFQDLILIRE